MKVRKASVHDAFDIAKVHIDCWRTTYKGIIPDDFLNKMSEENGEKNWKDIISKQNVCVAELNRNEIVGFATGGKERTGKYPNYRGELHAIYILQAHQRKGIGKQFLKPVIESLIQHNILSMAVTVLADNESRLFYENLEAKKIDAILIEIARKKLTGLVYGWKDIRTLI